MNLANERYKNTKLDLTEQEESSYFATIIFLVSTKFPECNR
jgi:hypothetical protein